MEHLQILKAKLSILTSTPEHAAIASSMLADIHIIEEEQQEFINDEWEKAHEKSMKLWADIMAGKPQFVSVSKKRLKEPPIFFKISAAVVEEIDPGAPCMNTILP